MSDESRGPVTSSSDRFRHRVGRVGLVGPPPHVRRMSDESDSVGATGRDTRVETREPARRPFRPTSRIPLPPRVAAPGVEESEATRRVAAKKGESTVALCRSDASD